MDSLPTAIRIGLRSAMDDFLRERLEGKLDKMPLDDPKREALLAQFQFDAWVADAAHRAGQIQLVTHSLKAIHPDAKGTNLYVPPELLRDHDAVGSHVLRGDFTGDVVGNAAALDVYKFLKLEYGGKTLLERVLEDDDHLAAALSDDEQQARAWMRAFADITHARGDNASHAKAKQVYWLVGDEPTNDGNYHLLAPLYATSLTHRIFQTVNEDRFGDAAKAARKARREGQHHGAGYHDYPNLAVQKLGGTKPQNISQLNSERGGNNYLLASLPPSWRSRDIQPPLKAGSVFDRFGRRPEVRRLIDELGRLLESEPTRNLHTRNQRDALTAAIVDELLQFAAELDSLEPGWSARAECRLNDAEKLWLDRRRAEIDAEFRAQRETVEWPREVRGRFANWLNERLGKRLTLGDIEHKHWATEVAGDLEWTKAIDDQRRWSRRLEKELNALQEELPR